MMETPEEDKCAEIKFVSAVTKLVHNNTIVHLFQTKTEVKTSAVLYDVCLLDTFRLKTRLLEKKILK